MHDLLNSWLNITCITMPGHHSMPLIGHLRTNIRRKRKEKAVAHITFTCARDRPISACNSSPIHVPLNIKWRYTFLVSQYKTKSLYLKPWDKKRFTSFAIIFQVRKRVSRSLDRVKLDETLLSFITGLDWLDGKIDTLIQKFLQIK